MKLSWYLLKRFLVSLLALTLITLALIGTNLSLQLGALLAHWYLPAFQVGSVNGDLWRGFTLHDLQYQHDGQQLQLQSVAGRLDWRCFSHNALCLHYLRLDGAVLSLQPTLPSAVTDTPTTIPNAPLPIRIEQLSVKNFTLQQTTRTVLLGELQSSLYWQQDKLALGDSQIRQVVITQQPADATKLAKAKPTVHNWQLPPLPDFPELAAIKLPLQLSLNSLALTDIRLLNGDKTELQLTNARLTANFSHQQWLLAITQFDAAEPLLQLTSQLDIKPQATQELALQLTVTQQPWLSGQQLSLSLQGPLQKTRLDARLLGQQQAQLVGTVDLSKPQPEFDVTLRSEALQYPATNNLAAANNSTVAPTPQAQTDDDTPTSYRLGNLQLQLIGSTQQLALAGHSQLQLPGLPAAKLQLDALYQSSEATLQVKQLQLQTLGGELQATASIDLATRQLQTELQLQKLQPGLFWAEYPGILSGKLVLDARLKQGATLLSIPVVELQGNLRDLPLQLSGSFTLEQQPEFWSLQSPGIALSHGPNQLLAKGSLTDVWDVALELKVPDLSQSLAQSEGRLAGHIHVSGAAKSPTLQLALTAQQLNYQDDYALSQAALHGSLVALGQQPSSLSLTAKDGQAPGLQLQQLDWQLTGTAQQHQSHLQIDSHQLQAAVALEGSMTNSSWQASWQEVRLKSDMGDWQLQQPLQTSWQIPQNMLTLSPSCWQDGAAKLCIKTQSNLSLQQGALSAQLEQLDLAAFNVLLEQHQSLSGRVDGVVHLGWQHRQLPTLQLQLQGGVGQFNFQSTSLLEIPWQQLNLTATVANNELTSALTIGFSSESEARLALKLQQLDSQHKTMDARFQLKAMDLGFLRPLLNDYSQFQAQLAGDIRASGPLANPEFQGSLALNQLTLTGRQAPMDIQHASLKLQLEGYQGHLAGELVTPEGRLDMTGLADWQQSRHWFAKLALKGERVSVHLPNTELTLSPDLQFDADASGGRLRGLVHIPKGNIEVDDLPQNATKVSDDEILINTQDLDYVAAEQWRLSSDVRLLLGEDVRLAAFGLKTRLEGELRVRQNGKQPTIHGQVNLQNGTFRAYGQDLQLRKGRLNFNGPADQPLMAIEAIRNPEKTEDGVIAGLRVNGLADNPVVEVFSTPAKPQANALAYLLMGRDLNSNSSDKSMTTSLIGIGIASSGKLVGQLGEVFGLKELSLDTAGSGTDSKVTVSGYLSPKLQVKYGVGIFNPFGEFTLRYRLMQKLYLEAVQSVNTSVDLLYKVEFD